MAITPEQAFEMAGEMFEPVTGQETINSGMYAHMYSPLHVSSVAEEDELIIAMGEELLAEINHYGAPLQSPQVDQSVESILNTDVQQLEYVPNLIENMANLTPFPLNFQQMIDDAQSHNMAVAAGEVLVPTMESTTNPTVSVEEIKSRRFMKNDDGEYIKETDYLFDNLQNRFDLMDFS
jgi:hypothetical protein